MRHRAFSLIAIVLVLFLLSPAFAGGIQMTVVNCEQWVSLRAEASVGSERLGKVPLGAAVDYCSVEGEFTRCEYQGTGGYIRTENLAPIPVTLGKEFGPVDPFDAEGDPVLDAVADGLRAVASSDCAPNGGERLRLAVYDPEGTELWGCTAITGDRTELTLLDAFLAGTEAEPAVAIRDSWAEELTLLDLGTGGILWTLKEDLGASCRQAVDPEGNIYICGSYGPEPVKIGPDGQVIWRSERHDALDLYWPYDLSLGEDVAVTYEGGTEYPVTVHFDRLTGAETFRQDLGGTFEALFGSSAQSRWRFYSRESEGERITRERTDEELLLSISGGKVTITGESRWYSYEYTDRDCYLSSGSLYPRCPNRLWHAVVDTGDEDVAISFTLNEETDRILLLREVYEGLGDDPVIYHSIYELERD